MSAFDNTTDLIDPATGDDTGTAMTVNSEGAIIHLRDEEETNIAYVEVIIDTDGDLIVCVDVAQDKRGFDFGLGKRHEFIIRDAPEPTNLVCTWGAFNDFADCGGVVTRITDPADATRVIPACDVHADAIATDGLPGWLIR